MVQKIVVTILGGAVLLAGIVMIVTPGPAVVVIPLGILLLGTEFAWAEKLGNRILGGLSRLREKWQSRKRRQAVSPHGHNFRPGELPARDRRLKPLYHEEVSP